MPEGMDIYSNSIAHCIDHKTINSCNLRMLMHIVAHVHRCMCVYHQHFKPRKNNKALAIDAPPSDQLLPSVKIASIWYHWTEGGAIKLLD